MNHEPKGLNVHPSIEGRTIPSRSQITSSCEISLHFSQAAENCSAGLLAGCTEGLPALGPFDRPIFQACRAACEKYRLELRELPCRQSPPTP